MLTTALWRMSDPGPPQEPSPQNEIQASIVIPKSTPAGSQMEAKTIPKSLKISSKRPPRTDLKNDSKNTSKLVPLDPQELSSRCSGSSIFTKSARSEKSRKIAPKWKPKWYQNRCEMVSGGFPKSHQEKVPKNSENVCPRVPHGPPIFL